MNPPTERLPTLYIAHGAGPCFWMELSPPFAPDAFDRLGAYLRGIDASLGGRPKAVLVVSAHWEAECPTVGAAVNPPLLFDYYGFPEHTYRLTYPAPGSPVLAARVRGLLAEAGLASDSEHARGFDHGVFVPFKLIYPDADVPIVQLSLQNGLDPATHIAIGHALTPLRDEGILIVGSGMSYHNMRPTVRGGYDEAAERFDGWLNEAVTSSDPETRNRMLAAWSSAPHARDCHPREEHLIPLMVVAGAAGDETGQRVYHDRIGTKPISGFQFGGALTDPAHRHPSRMP